MVYYFYTFVGNDLTERTYSDFSIAYDEAKRDGQAKFRDTMGGEYFIN
jgi:hypothetical protein